MFGNTRPATWFTTTVIGRNCLSGHLQVLGSGDGHSVNHSVNQPRVQCGSGDGLSGDGLLVMWGPELVFLCRQLLQSTGWG